MTSRTIFLSKLIGLYCILIGLSIMTRGQATVETVTALLQNSAMTFLGQLHYRELFYVYAAISLVLGVYLTYGGFKSRSS